MNEAPSNGTSARRPYAEPLLPLIWRHASLAQYRRSPRGRREQLDPAEAMPVLSELLAVWLAERLPPRLVCRLDVGGLFRLGRLMGRLMTTGANAILAAGRAARWLKRLVLAPKLAPDAAGHFIAQSPVENAQVLIGTSVLLRGYRLEPEALTCYFEATQRVANEGQIFVHLFPELPASLPPERAAHGCLCKDHHPAVPFTQWPRGRVIVDRTSLADVAPGYYRVCVGLVDLATVQRVPVDGQPNASIDLGWVRLGSSPAAADVPGEQAA